MKKAFACIWLVAFLICLLLAGRNYGSWREFARSPAQVEGEITGYADHGASRYAFRVSEQVYRGSGRSPEAGENMFIGRVVRVFYCAVDPTINSLMPPSNDVGGYARGRFIDYVGYRMLCVSLILAMIHLTVTRTRGTLPLSRLVYP